MMEMDSVNADHRVLTLQVERPLAVDSEYKASHDLLWDEYQRERQAAEIHSEGLVIEEITEDDMGYDADTEVVYPDAYEEPTSGVRESFHVRNDPLENDVIWQSGIVDHMETLDCNSDANDTPRRSSWLKGRKRRSRTTTVFKHVQRQGANGSSEFEISEVFDDDGRYSPKRVRRRSRNTDPRSIHFEQAAAREKGPDPKPNSSLAGNIDPLDKMPVEVDAMDID